MTSPTRLASLALVSAAFLGCGDARLKVSGTVSLTLQQLGQPDGTTGFSFPADTVVESNPTGYCRVNAGRAEFLLERQGGTADGLRSIHVVLPPSSATGSDPPTVNLVVGTTTFDGSNTCTRQSTVTGSGDTSDVQVTLECTGLRAAGDARTVAAQVRLSLYNCAKQ